MTENKGNSSATKVALYGAAAMELGVMAIGGFFGGMWIDKKWDVTPWGTLIGFLLGSVTGFFHLYKIIVVAQKTKDDAE